MALYLKPPTVRVYLQYITFAVLGPHARNSLPTEIHCVWSFAIFKCSLYVHISPQCFYLYGFYYVFRDCVWYSAVEVILSLPSQEIGWEEHQHDPILCRVGSKTLTQVIKPEVIFIDDT